jgi:uncharacterized repeat protein (TIGR01451 family)
MKKSKIILSVLTLMSTLIFVPCFEALALAGPWGPERPTFRWEKPAEYAVFNSMENNPDLGDERNFVRIREVGAEKYADEVKMVAGKEYEVYSYYHNNAEVNIGKTAIGIADNVRMSANFPAQIRAGERLAVNTIITADDTDPLAVWDGAFITADSDLYLRYVPGTAIIHNGGWLNGQNIGPEYLFSEKGAALGYDKFSGLLPGCNEYAGYVTYRIRADKPDFNIAKKVSKYGENNYIDSVVSAKGGIVEFKVTYENTGTMVQENVRVKDVMGEGLVYVKGSSFLKNNSDPDGSYINDDVVGVNGVNIGNYAGGNGWAELTYRARIGDGVKCEGVLINTVNVITNDGAQEDTAEVVVEKCVPGELPVTGPGEVVIAVVAVGAIGVGGTYWWRSRKALKKITDSIE